MDHSSTLTERDLQHLWHPCSQMKDFEQFPPVSVRTAQGSYIELENGQRLIDSGASWWCKSLGHAHPVLKAALKAQADRLEHVILSNTAQEPVVRLSERLGSMLPGLTKVLYASDGACAIEIAMKLAVHARQLRGEPQRTGFMALSGAYHGETCGALSVSDLGVYRKPYESMLMDVPFLQGVPYVSGTDDPLWSDCSAVWPAIEKQLLEHADLLTAILVEPIVQGANGMLIYSADFLKRLREWTQAQGIYLIADEIMTGFGRTGRLFASEHAGITPDFVCVGKGLTAGWLPLSAVITSDAVYDLFYDDYETGKSFLHSHTYAGNALAAAVANASLEVLEQEMILEQVQQNMMPLFDMMQSISDETGCLQHVRGLGAIVAADLVPTHANERLGFAVFQEAVKRGALLRPIGNTIYWTPPLNTSRDTLGELRDITCAAVQAVFKRD